MVSVADPLGERFWSKVQKTDGCWLWTAGTEDGYGRYGLNQTSVLAHRLAYMELVGPVPAGLQLDHLCRVRACVNPAHLEPVTLRENVRRGMGPAGVNAAKTHCPNGHPYDYTERGGRRRCKACRNARARALWAAKRGAA